MREETLYVELLGKIELKNSQGTVNRQTLHSGRLTHLLLYLLLHRKEELTMRRLCDVLWRDGSSDNPAGALKNLMYRLRNSLKVLGKQSFILTGNGSYRWNPEIPVIADFEEFEQRYQNAMDSDLPEEERIENAEEAIERYKGHISENILTEEWALPIDTYYLSMYLDVVKLLSHYYSMCEDYRRAEQVSAQGLLYTGYNEELHCNVIKALIKQGKHALAVFHYNNAIKQFHEQEGTKERGKLDELYERLLAAKNEEHGSLRQVVSEINHDSYAGVFLCEYGVFKEIYRLERRRLERSGVPAHLLLLTLSNHEAARLGDQELMNKMMERVSLAVNSSVRRGDVATRYSDVQYMILLVNCNGEDAKKAAERIVKNFRRRIRAPYMKLEYDMWEVTASSSLTMEDLVQVQ